MLYLGVCFISAACSMHAINLEAAVTSCHCTCKPHTLQPENSQQQLLLSCSKIRLLFLVRICNETQERTTNLILCCISATINTEIKLIAPGFSTCAPLPSEGPSDK
ncbi:hypothetical protein M758_3G179000 [Ceratodon purpureus]|uniref:Secreted protein n=1 Tax=Ceratodon purpureus TaxID=3225 RepID=A0A8T0IJN2_CERPU|nr:hypothetical protein KC19_3G178300 [Ceratodon purpureus]KAG0623498.1 hypothetical protein M758_3G179000 [Ceratodon purpureus]